jgi:hypothetical protein
MVDDPMDVLGLAEWFLDANLEISAPFWLDENRKVADPKVFLARMRGDVGDLIEGQCPRNRYGAVAKDLRLLRAYVEGSNT